MIGNDTPAVDIIFDGEEFKEETQADEAIFVHFEDLRLRTQSHMKRLQKYGLG